MWYAVGMGLTGRVGRLGVRKVAGHTTRAMVDSGLVLEQDFVGNGFADEHADAMAAAVQLDEVLVATLRMREQLAIRIQKRLVSTTLAAIREDPRPQAVDEADWDPSGYPVEPPPPAPEWRHPLAILAEGSQHQLQWEAGDIQDAARVFCTQCRGSASSRALAGWLRTGCTPAIGAGAGVERVHLPNGQPVDVGYQRLHASHRLRHLRGIWWCGKCGCHATSALGRKSRASGLVRGCAGFTTTGTAYTLRRLNSGLTPKMGQVWPS